MDNKIVTARFATDDNYVNVYYVYQWSYGHVLRIEGLKLPNMVEIHFSLQETSGEAKTRIGVTKDGVTDVVIPDSFLENEGIGDKYKIFVWVYVADKNSGSTEYKITIHVKARAKPEITHGGQDGEVFQEAVEAVRDAAARAAESEKQAERWAVGRVDIPGSETDNSKFYSEESKKNAQQTTKDKEAVEELVKETENIGQLAEDVKANAQKASESAKNAETSATNASASEKNAKTSESNASTSETNAKASEANAKASEQAVEKSKQTVDKTVADFGQAVTDASAALKSEKDAHVKAITTAGTTETKKVTDEGAKQVQTVQSMGTQETEKVTAEGTKQVGLVKTEGEKHLASVQTAAQEIIADREQINTNKEGVAQLKEDLSELSEDIADIKQNGTGTGNGATTAQANSLWVIIQKSAFAQQLTDAEINEFKTTWGITEEVEPDTPTTYTITRNLTNCTSSSEVTSIDEGSAYTETITANNGYTLTGATVSVTMGDSNITSSYSNGVLNISSVTGNIVLTVSAVQETTEPDNPEVTLTSISATYTGGNVTVGTSVTDLTGITVTGTYSDGSTSTITGYTLSGEIVEGSNIITVSYGGKTTTFTVTGIAEEIEYTELSNSADSWEVGGIVPQGSAEINTARLRTIATLSDDVKKISVDDGYSYILVVYNEEQTEIPTNTNTTLFEGKGYYNPNGIAGSYNNDGFLTSQGNYFGGEMIISEVHANINSIPSGSLSGTAHFRILLKNNDNATLTADDGLHIHLWG